MRSPLERVMLTCAVTGNLTRPEQTPHLPITPRQVAESALEAAEAGAAAVHLHVRDPQTGRPSMELEHYREVVERIRERNRSLIINLTTGPGGRFMPSEDDPRVAGPGTTLVRPELRVNHVEALRPEVATLDLNTMNFAREVVINTPRNVRIMAGIIRGAGTLPEIELFDSGDIAFLSDLLADGTLARPLLCSFVLGVSYGFQPSAQTVAYALGLLPDDAQFTAMGIGRWMFPMVAQSYLCGGHVRVGLEDGVYLERGRLAKSNAELVAKARRMVEDLGGQLMTAGEARQMLSLPAAA